MAKHSYQRTPILFLLGIILLFSCYRASAQQAATHIIHINSGDIHLAPNAAKWMDSMRPIATTTEPALAFIHFNTLPTQSEKETLKKQGITLLDYLPDNTFSAHIRFPLGNEAMPLSVHSITNVKPEWKATDYLWKKIATQKGRIEVLVTFYPTITPAAAKQFISTIGGQLHASKMERYGAYKVIIDATLVRAIASWYGVQNICPVTDMVPLDLQSRPAVKGNTAVNSIANGGYGLDGSGVTVGIGDNCSGFYHADLKDRINNYNPVGKGTHGTHVNGIVGGAGNIDPLGQGMAPNCNLIDYFYDQVLAAAGTMYRDYNMTITNNSYGVILGDCSYSGTYDGYAHFLDTLAVEYPNVLNVFASGNDGLLNCTPYPAGFGTVGGGYQPAKNDVVVGSMTDYLGQANDESRGPTKDGRLKPDITAIGLGAYSTILEDAYEWAAGTSMAAPQVSGGLALLTQRYKQINSGTQPAADVLKAILLNGADDLGNPGPDFSYGFGGMDIAKSLRIIDSNWFSTNSVNNNDSQSVSLYVPPNTAQLKIMLCWADVPGNPSSARQLVNDLDLSVITPASSTRYPLVPDGTPANVNNTASERPDHLNNTEQVVITTPATGVYTIKVKGYNVPYPAQKYVLAYDMQPIGIKLTYPIGGEQITNIDTGNKYDSVRFFWNADNDGHTFKVEFSSNAGATWLTISDTIPAASRYIAWRPFGYNSEKCQVRLSRNGTTDVYTSGNFTINNLTTITPDTVQCPGYINIHWGPVPNANGYEMLAKQGAHMAVVATVTDTFYSFKNMPLSQKSYVAVRPLINGVGGYRSVAAIVTANSGNCTNPISQGDLMIEKITGPLSGRMYTNTQLGTTETLKVKVRDLYTTACSNYSISYSINNGAWQVFTSGPIIPANGTVTVSIPGLDLSAIGTYNFQVAIHNQALTDPVSGNDSISYTIKNIPNDTLTLPFFDGFDSMGVVAVTGRDSLGITPNGRWDFQTYDSAGRIRSFVNDDITISGTRSISMDENQDVTTGSYNTFTGTFNLAGYDTSSAEIRLDFDYMLHGTPKKADGNTLIIKSSSTANWAPFFTYNLSAYPGFLNHARSLSLTDAVRADNSNFTRSLMLAFGQSDTSLIAAPDYGNGITLDNVKIYTVTNDAQLTQIISPAPTNCGLTGNQPVSVLVHNGVNYTLHNVQLYYKMDGGTTYTGTIDSITAKQVLTYTFPQQITIPIDTTHSMDIWLSVAGDTYNPNDSILQYRFRNNTIISAFPYLEDFEKGNGGYYTGGVNSSWQYGTPASAKVNKAASGTKAWKTNLTGRYNNLETSYLYSPCFDISSLTSPMLSFSTAMDIENCGGTMCDKGYIEYTTDGSTWTKLGHSGQGTNWYDSTFNVWNTNGFTRWHVASIPLPPGNVTMSFRIALASDPGATFEGIAVDDIHIFDRANGIYPASGMTTVTQNASGNTWLGFVNDSGLVASLQPNNDALGNTNITLYKQDGIANPGATQYTFPRSYAITTQSPVSSVGLRLYLLEKDMLAVLSDTTCPSCTPVTDAYSLGITQYKNYYNPAAQNGSLGDDTGGAYAYNPFKLLKWVPYDAGYYAEGNFDPNSEFWFNNGGPTGTVPAVVDFLNFVAIKNGNDAQLYWRSVIDTAVQVYILERSTDSVNFASVLDTLSVHGNPGQYAHTEYAEFPASPVVYYRLRWVMTGKTDTLISPIRKLQNADDENSTISFTAQMTGKGKIGLNWVSYIDGIAKSYTMEREINSGGYTTISNTAAARHYGQQYNTTDAPPDARQGDLISYRLTALLDNGIKITLPIRTVEWAEPNTVTAIYPNPSADGSLNITWYAPPGTNIELNLTDITGKSMYSASYQASHWKNTTTIETPCKPQGIYILRCNIAGNKNAQKVVFDR